jgi:hypothetical protein
MRRALLKEAVNLRQKPQRSSIGKPGRLVLKIHKRIINIEGQYPLENELRLKI